MEVQDAIFAVGAIVLCLALLPTVLGQHKPAFSTALLTTAALAVFSACFATLGLWLACASNALNGSLWGIIALQVLRRRHRARMEGAC